MYEAAAIDGVKNRWQELVVRYPARHAPAADVRRGDADYNELRGGGYLHPIWRATRRSIMRARRSSPTCLDYGSTRLDMGYASAIATILFLLMVGTNKLVQRLLRRVGN